MYSVYGIKNCDTMKKATTWLTENNIPFEFHDYKKEGISEAKIREWLGQKPWDVLINKAGTTWKKLTEEEKATDENSAIKLMIEKPSMIKRPIVELDKIVVMGFKSEDYKQIFK
ncbi:MAG: ArsC family reductase [Arcicella sp.]|jgi:arsenate reductase|nr:ArsC family reductase [Arcicella sp.]